MSTTRYFISLPEPAQASIGGDYGFTAHGPDGFAEQLQAALSGDALFVRWRDAQDEPDEVDPQLALTDPGATVTGEQHDLRIDLVATTHLPGDVLRHRLRLLAGHHWQLRDVRAA